MMDMLPSDSDCESFSESSGSEDQDDIESTYGGQAQCIFSSLEESIGKIDDLLAIERGYVHGDIVRSITDPSGQMGRVMNVDVIVDLETLSGGIIKDVNGKKLLKICSFASGDYVVHGPWLGRVDKVVDRVTILFDDGEKCEVTNTDPENLLPISPNLLEDAQYPYYPGQRVRVRLSSVSKSSRWSWGAWKENQVEGTVCHVEAELVYVDWVASAIVGCDSNFPAPPHQQDSKSLTLLLCFPHANWELGDWCKLPLEDQRLVREHVFSNLPTQELINKHKKSGQQSDFSSNFEEMYVIVKKKTKVDVLWQDGSHSSGMCAESLFPVNSIGDHEFWPEQLVQEKGTYDDPHVSSGQRLGIVKSVDANERTVRVEWRTPVVNRTIDLGGEDNEETVSAYELIEHPEYSYCPGDVVFRLEKNHSVVHTDGKNENHENHLKTEVGMGFSQLYGESKYKHVSEAKDVDPFKCYLSCIGTVTGSKDGSIEVRWASGLISKVEPYEIVGIDNYEASAATPAIHEESVVGNLNQEMLEYGEQSWNLKGKDVLEKTFNDIDEDCNKDLWKTSAYFLPRAAIRFFTNVMASLFGSYGSTSEDANRFCSLHGSEVLENCDVNAEGPPLVVDDLKTFRQTILKQKLEEKQENKGLFKPFDIVGDCSDHHFVNGSGKELMLSQVKRGWLKKVQQEWSTLEKDLPDMIYIRVYEERIDLLRAAIVGAPGTPYHDGLFFFDIFLPPEYPHEPPLVHYKSGGLRVNPNLYESGKVCLSLLKTWTGTGTEVWNPGSSTILQVLLSLQALVLNEKPYFNEAGYDEQKGRAEGEKNSMTYNENAFLLSCKSMLYLLRNPPKNFEALVEEHFRRRSHFILLACKAYMDGAPVGCPFGCGMAEQETKSSTGFKIMLAKIFPKLVHGFIGKGVDCSQFIEKMNV